MFLLHPSVFVGDLVIALILTLCISGLIACSVWLKKNPSHIARSIVQILRLVAVLSFLIMTYSAFIEPNIIVITKKSIDLPLEKPLKIVVLGDMHFGPTKGSNFAKKIVKKVNQQLPDIVILTGDYVYDPLSSLAPLQELKNLNASMGVVGVLGNHDQGQYALLTGQKYYADDLSEQITSALEDANVTVLRNENITLRNGDESLTLIGVDDVWTGHTDLESAMNDMESDSAKILISHNPSIIENPLSASASLILSGHTHGGQVRLPGIGSLAHLPISIKQTYDQGEFTVDDTTTLLITRGLGESSARVRLWAWPEIVVVESY